ncbi:MAG: hypothetical protein E3J56_02365 [Candidatus Aminicenantes bacterium]|nr:MAG: hypothetical protein E3J56_02365 [Candidatus Aminicenantes bacterium]
MRVKQSEQKEIGRIKLSDTQDLVISIVNDEKLDIRTWVDLDSYKGFTKKGIRLYLFDDNWEQFKEIMEKVNKEYEQIA